MPDPEAIFGIDPGKSGAIAMLWRGKIERIKLSETETDIGEWLENRLCNLEFAYLERVSAMPGQGVTSMFKFGQSFGFCRGLLIAFCIPFELVSPQVWQRKLGCLSGGNKNVTKAKAQELFPDYKWTHATSDAVLIAEYGRRTRLGK